MHKYFVSYFYAGPPDGFGWKIFTLDRLIATNDDIVMMTHLIEGEELYMKKSVSIISMQRLPI